MRVLLLRPNSAITDCPVPLGLGYVAGALRRERGDQVEILDARNLRLRLDQVGEKIRHAKPGVIGISALNCEMSSVQALAAAAKAEQPRTPVILGGPYASACREAILDDSNVDVAVLGEGEETAVELLGALESGDDLERVKGIAFRRNGEKVCTQARNLVRDIDQLEVAWDLLHPEQYFGRWSHNSAYSIRHDHRLLSVFTSRGCPHTCIFCHNVFGKRFRARSAESVLEEISLLVNRYGVREIEITDDTFSQSLGRAKAICKGIIDRDLNIKISFTSGLCADRTDPELLDLLREAGLYQILFAVESASPRIQKLIGKKIDLDRVKWSIEQTAKRGVLTRGSFLMGFPTETYEEMIQTGQWAAASELHLASFYFLNPFPGTEVAGMAGKDLTHLQFRDYATPPTNLSAATDEELRAANRYANRRFYLSPKRLARIAKAVPKNMSTILSPLLLLRVLAQGSIST